MIIKAYSGHIMGHISIYEKVKDVVVHLGCYDDTGPTIDERSHLMPSTWIEPLEYNGVTPEELENYKYIDFTNEDNIRCRLRVGSFAYICNDDGKTVEKVIANG